MREAMVLPSHIVMHEKPRSSQVRSIAARLGRGEKMPSVQLSPEFCEHWRQGPLRMDSTGIGYGLIDGHHRLAAHIMVHGRNSPLQVEFHGTRPVQGPAAQFFPKENFDLWFQSSKVVDEKGMPLVMFHGTGSDIHSFDPLKIGKNFDVSTLGFYFTNAARMDLSKGFGFGTNASEYASNAGGSPNVMPVYLSLKDPLILDDANEWGGSAKMLDVRQSDIRRWARAGGHDGVIARDASGEDPEIVCVAFHPGQIKSSIGNVGIYDFSNADITDRRANSAQEALIWLKNNDKKVQPSF